MGTRVPVRAMVCCISVLSIGCSVEDSAIPPFERFDSSGVEVVISHRPRGFETPWTVSKEAILRIGKGREEEPYLFGVVQGAVRLEDESIVVLDSQWRELRRFDRNGDYIVSFGGPGEGSGEFQSVMPPLQRSGDTLIVLDYQGTLTYFDPDGNLLAETPPGGPRPADGNSRGQWQGVLSDGVLWGSRYPLEQARPTGQVYRNPYWVVISDPDRREVIPLAEYRQMAFFRDSEGRTGQYYPFFTTAAVQSRNPVGVLVGDNETFSIDLFESDGTYLRRMVFPGGIQAPGRTLLEETRLAVQKRYEAEAEMRPESPSMVAWAAQLPAPHVWPGFRELVSDEEGFVWAPEFRVGDFMPLLFAAPSKEPYSAWVFHPDGYVLGSVEIPGGFYPYEIGSDYLLGVRVDSLGVNEVVLYGLQRREE